MKKTQTDTIMKYCLQNAIFYNGRADPGAVLGKILASEPELRNNINEARKEVENAVKRVNSMSLDKQKAALEKLAPKMLEKEAKKQEALPPLHNAIKGRVVTRFAPSPSGPLMLPHLLRAVFLSYLYAKKYDGKFILRIEDTDPASIKKEYYEWIKEDLRNAGVKWDRIVIESNNMGLYYKHAESLIKKGDIYSCHCSSDRFREFKLKKQNCPCRDDSKKDLDEWNKALKGKYNEREIAFRLKTSMKDPNPALRDPPMLRIIKASHPFKRRAYNIWPLYNYANVIEDHNSGITHVFRGKEHEHNTNIQKMLYQKLGWDMPEVINFGMIYLPGEKLHTRDIKVMLEKKQILGWDDPRLPTVRALIRRGFQPEAFRLCAISCGLTKTDIRFSWDMLETANRRIIDAGANRYMVVTDPVRISVKNSPETSHVLENLHPDFPKRGKKKIPVNLKEIYISREDYNNLKGKEFRLKSLGNIKLKGKTGLYTGNEIARDMQKIQWVSKPHTEVEIVKPSGVIQAIGEISMKNLRAGDIIQMERIGFGKIEKAGREVTIVFGHK